MLHPEHTTPEFRVSLLRAREPLHSPLLEGGPERLLGGVDKATNASTRRFSLTTAAAPAASAASASSAAAAIRSTLGSGLGSAAELVQFLPWRPRSLQ